MSTSSIWRRTPRHWRTAHLELAIVAFEFVVGSKPSLCRTGQGRLAIVGLFWASIPCFPPSKAACGSVALGTGMPRRSDRPPRRRYSQRKRKEDSGVGKVSPSSGHQRALHS
ncbi:hypothetical protein BDP67DRAFT_434472 [Colletotrichum lupini]|nr:hypothetical protein BDP67DRAFT_434472 [Colletotrichum lupini]